MMAVKEKRMDGNNVIAPAVVEPKAVMQAPLAEVSESRVQSPLEIVKAINARYNNPSKEERIADAKMQASDSIKAAAGCCALAAGLFAAGSGAVLFAPQAGTAMFYGYGVVAALSLVAGAVLLNQAIDYFGKWRNSRAEARKLEKGE